MRRVFAVLILSVLMLNAVPVLAAEQKSIPVSEVLASEDGLVLVRSAHGMQTVLYDEDGNEVLTAPKDVFIYYVHEKNSDGERVQRIFAAGKCAIVYTYDDQTREQKYGLMNKKGQLLCDCAYDLISTFSEGIAAVRKDDKYGYINTKGELIAECRWDEAKEYDGGMAVVRKGEKYSVLDKKGNVIGKNYLRVQDQVDGYMAVETSKGWGVINSKGEQVIKCKYTQIRVNGKGIFAVQDQKNNNTSFFAFMNAKGKLLTKYIYNWPSKQFSDGLMIVEYYSSNQLLRVGAMNEKGKVTLVFGTASDCEVGDFNNGICYVRQSAKKYDASKRTWGYMDKKGKWVIELKARTYVPATNKPWLSSKLIKIQTVGSGQAKFGFMDKTGKVICKCKYDDIGPFVDGIAPVYQFQGNTRKTGYINTKGKLVIPCEWLSGYNDSQKNGLLVLSKENEGQYFSTYKRACFTKAGKTILPAEYSSIVIGEHTLLAVKDGQMLFFDLKGNPIMQEEAPAETTEIPADTGEAA